MSSSRRPSPSPTTLPFPCSLSTHPAALFRCTPSSVRIVLPRAMTSSDNGLSGDENEDDDIQVRSGLPLPSPSPAVQAFDELTCFCVHLLLTCRCHRRKMFCRSC